MAAEPAKRRLVLHFNLPRTLLVGDPDGKGNAEERIITTELALKTALADQAWGIVEDEEFVLSHPDVQVERPSDEMYSYTEFLTMKFPIQGQSKFTQDENRQLHEQMILEFVKTGPGAKLRASFDQMVKAIAFPKPLAKALNMAVPILDETSSEDCKYQPDKGKENLTRFGRYIFVPAFFTLIQTLTKEKRDFSIVFHSMSADVLDEAVLEMNAYANGEHPCFNGQNKTKKALFNGEKGSKDLRVQPMDRGVLARRAMTLEFQQRPQQLPKPGEDFPLMFEPTVLKKGAAIYSGLVHRVCTESGCAAILHDQEYWVSDKKNGGKLFFVDTGDSLEDVQQIFFDGSVSAKDPSALRMQDVVTNEAFDHSSETFNNVYVHYVEDVRQLVLNPLYFVEQVAACESQFEKFVEKSRAKLTASTLHPLLDLLKEGGAGLDEQALLKKALADKGAKDYLYATVIPVLFGGLEQVAKFRPDDPCEFLAFYLMRHANGYNRTLRLED
ncbi:unnamed protein product [Amoebophrya sp. A120]|nr:unnamed protein product [Amoebophrya sp. A120]|eukprot:GSA120T00000827001.1